MDILLLFYKKYKGEVEPVDYINWALKMLENNHFSFSINILSSLREPLNIFEIEDYFRRALKELDLQEPLYEECAEYYIWYLSKQILKDKENALDIAYGIYKVVDYPENLAEWFNISEMIDDFRYGDNYLNLDKAALITIIMKEAQNQLERSNRK
ncbi:hypothetical protein [Metabacillus fastidiosus]|uniref:hypothetical protein n=1 Tax=Metabacillus fastidiosus TaxID=1458 RepID=UPI003D277442